MGAGGGVHYATGSVADLGRALAERIGLLAGPTEQLHQQRAVLVGDVGVALLSESGQWSTGTNAFVLRLTRDGTPVNAGKVSLSTSMAMPGMAPMITGAIDEKYC